jgi:hypothetical protein
MYNIIHHQTSLICINYVVNSLNSNGIVFHHSFFALSTINLVLSRMIPGGLSSNPTFVTVPIPQKRKCSSHYNCEFSLFVHAGANSALPFIYQFHNYDS